MGGFGRHCTKREERPGVPLLRDKRQSNPMTFIPLIGVQPPAVRLAASLTKVRYYSPALLWAGYTQ